MSIRRKGSRTINHAGQTYRWVVSAGDMEGLGIVVELEKGAGQRAVTWFDHGTIIAPGLVARTISAMQQMGWTPEKAGRELRFRIAFEASPDDEILNLRNV